MRFLFKFHSPDGELESFKRITYKRQLMPAFRWPSCEPWLRGWRWKQQGTRREPCQASATGNPPARPPPRWLPVGLRKALCNRLWACVLSQILGCEFHMSFIKAVVIILSLKLKEPQLYPLEAHLSLKNGFLSIAILDDF